MTKKTPIIIAFFYVGMIILPAKAQSNPCDISPVTVECLESLRQRSLDAMHNNMMRSIQQAQEFQQQRNQTATERPPAVAYFNRATRELYVGDRVFSENDVDTALSTFGLRNSKSPSGVGWERLTDQEYTGFIARIRGLEPAANNDQQATIYRNCVIEKSKGLPENAIREVRAECRAISLNPTWLQRRKWSR